MLRLSLRMWFDPHPAHHSQKPLFREWLFCFQIPALHLFFWLGVNDMIYIELKILSSFAEFTT